MKQESKSKKGDLVAELTTAIEAVLKQNDSDSSKRIGKTIKYASEEVVKKFLKRVKQKDKKAQKQTKKATDTNKNKPVAKPKAKKAVVTE